MGEDRLKPAEWLGSTLRDLQAFPDEMQDELGYALFLVQSGERPSICKTYQGAIEELRANYDQNRTFRLVYVARFEEAVYVLHIFQKKSKDGIATVGRDRELIEQRFKEAKRKHEAYVKEHKDESLKSRITEDSAMSTNIFADIGVPNPNEHLIKAKLVSCAAKIIQSKELPQSQVAEMTGITQPQVSNILRGRFRDISIEKLLNIINSLDHNVQIVIDAEPVKDGEARTVVNVSH